MPPESPTKYRLIVVILVIGMVSLTFRIWLLNKRWINPDEGAHLMDAVFILDGKIPSVDFDSRQPIYAYANAAVLKLLGVNYISGRLLPMTCSVLVGFMVFVMAFMLFDRQVAILSAAIYWLLPLELMNSVIVKTEPLVLLLTCLSLCAVILFSQGNRTAWLLAAGVFACMGFYVRQSALIIPLVVLGILLIYHKGNLREIAKGLAIFILGYISVILLAMIYYIRFMSLSEFIMSDLSPFGFLASAGKKLFYIIGMSFNSANDVTYHMPEASIDKYSLYHKYIRQSVMLHLFLLIGLSFSLITFSRRFFSGSKSKVNEHVISYPLLYLWIFSLFIGYIYFFHAAGFYIDYFREFLPPLAITFSAWLCSSVPAFEGDKGLGRLIVGGLLLSAIIFVAEWYLKKNLGASIVVCLPLVLFTFFYFSRTFGSKSRRLIFWFSLAALIIIIILSRQAPLIPYFSGIVPKLAIIGAILAIPLALLTKKNRPTLKEYMKYMSYCVALGAFTLSLSYSAKKLPLSYESVWSPDALEKTSVYLKNHTFSNDTVMSGAVIWELQAQRKPFLGISHPLSFEGRISAKEHESLEAAIRSQPPEVIILDSRTEKTYFRQIPWLRDFLSSRYNLVYTAEPARQPVLIYQQKGKIEASPHSE